MKKKIARKLQLAKETLLHLQGGADDTMDGRTISCVPECRDVRTISACTPGCIDAYSDTGGHCKYQV